MTSTHLSKLGFFGFGNMAQAIWLGAKQYCHQHHIHAQFTRRQRDIATSLSASLEIDFVSEHSCLTQSDLLILAIKPQQLESIKPLLSDINWSKTCVVSLLAGTPLKRLYDAFPDIKHIIRVMPNTAASIGESMSIMTPGEFTSPDWVQTTQDLFNTIGKTLVIPEHLMDFCTGLCGSGPAYLYAIADALTTLATHQGISQEDASLLVNQLFLGSSKNLNQTTQTPSEMIQAISSPNGTTVAGLKTFDELSISSAIQSVILSAAKRSEELSQ